MNNNLENQPATLTQTATLTQPAKLTQPATLTKMDSLNQTAFKVMVTQGTAAAVKHMFTDETTGQTLTYLEMRERYG